VNSGVRTVPFVKASACGNDFLLIDFAFAPTGAAIHEFTRRICDRHNGIGADGVEWMLSHPTADTEIRLINADGTDAEISGNGTRCVAAYLCAEQGKERISIQTGAGLKTCLLTARNDFQYEFEMGMGTAAVEEESSVRTSKGEFVGVRVSVGNPHFVTFVPQFSPDWQRQAAEIQRAVVFKEGVNVEFVVVEGNNDIGVRFFERGVGETQSSGTGSCASAAVAVATRRAESPVKVHAAGGTQTVRWDGNDIFLRGPARLVGRGEFFPD